MGRDHRRVDPRLDPGGALLGDRQQLHRVPELPRERYVLGRDVPDPLDVDVLQGAPPAGGEPDQDRQLVRRVDAVDVERRVGLRQPRLLGLGEHLGERLPLLRHAGEDVVAGAVDDPVDPEDPVRREPLPHRADDGDAAADARLETDVDALFGHRVHDLRPALRQERLVRRDDRLAVADRLQEEVLRRPRAADQLDDDPDVRVPRDLHAVADERPFRELHAAVPLRVGVRDADQLHGNPHALAKLLRVLEQQLHRARAHGPEADHPDADLLQRLAHLALPRAGDWSIVFTPRIAWRIRCSFSHRANRTYPSPSSPKPTPGNGHLGAQQHLLENSSDPIRERAGWGPHEHRPLRASIPTRSAAAVTRQSRRFR
jgi:hypothetical protein